jgi:hypothetical protein
LFIETTFLLQSTLDIFQQIFEIQEIIQVTLLAMSQVTSSRVFNFSFVETQQMEIYLSILVVSFNFFITSLETISQKLTQQSIISSQAGRELI